MALLVVALFSTITSAAPHDPRPSSHRQLGRRFWQHVVTQEARVGQPLRDLGYRPVVSALAEVIRLAIWQCF